MSAIDRRLVQAARALSATLARLTFGPPVTHVYNPLVYAASAHEMYLRKFGATGKRVVFVGMNPGPFGMVQTGVPFGEVAAVRDWMGITAAIGQPAKSHPQRAVRGFDCLRSEVSGRRLWGLFAARFGRAERFFADHFVVNYCPLAFFDAAGRNVTPEQLPAAIRTRLCTACDEHLRQVVAALRPAWVIGVGGFAENRARVALADYGLRFGRILHPSPASPAANRDWAAAATRQLVELGVWQ